MYTNTAHYTAFSLFIVNNLSIFVLSHNGLPWSIFMYPGVMLEHVNLSFPS